VPTNDRPSDERGDTVLTKFTLSPPDRRQMVCRVVPDPSGWDDESESSSGSDAQPPIPMSEVIAIQWPIVKYQACIILGATALVAITMFCRLLVTISCAGNVEGIIFPNVIWHSLWDYGTLCFFGSIFTKYLVSSVFRPCVLPDLLAMNIIVTIWPIGMVVFMYIILTVLKDPGKKIVARVASSILYFFIFYLVIRRTNINCKVPNFMVDKVQYLKENAMSVVQFARFSVVFGVGYYSCLFFASKIFGTCVDMVKEATKNEETGETNALFASGVEILLVFAFYSFIIPLWSKCLSREAHRVLMLRTLRGLEKSKSEKTFYFGSSGQQTESYSEHLADDKSLADPDTRRNFENFYMKAISFINFMLDLTRYAYGRGVLFELSRPEVFLLLSLKDICYHIWNFGFKHSDWILVFTMKIFSPNAFGNISRFWKTCATIVQVVANFSQLKSLTRCWTIPFDYASAKGRADEKTKFGVKLSFCNMAVFVKNLPDSFAEDLEFIKRHGQYRSLNVDIDKCSESERNSNMGERKKGGGRGLIDASNLMNYDPQSEGHQMSGDDDGEDRIDKETLGFASKKEKQLPPGVGTILDTIEEEPPVSDIEKKIFLDVVNITQMQIYLRFQIRSTAKMFTSFIFIAIPLILGLTSAKNHPNYASFDLSKPTKESNQYLLAMITFFVMDFSEYMYMTTFLIRNAKCGKEQVTLFRNQISQGHTLKIMLFFAAFSGVFLFQTKFDPHHDVVLQSIKANNVLADTDPTTWAWKDVYSFCGWT